MTTAIYPYERLEFGAGLKIEFSGEVPARNSAFEYSFVGIKRPAAISGEISVSVPDTLERFFPSSEEFRDELDVVVVWECDRSRRRGIVRLTADSMLRLWSTPFSLSCDQLSGLMKFSAYGVRKNDAVRSVPGFASLKGTILFSSNPNFVVEIDEPLDQKGADLASLWIDFSDPKAGLIPNEYPEAVYHLSMEKGEPVLYLNEALPDELRFLLSDEKQRGPKAYARDAFFAPIEADVWEQLATDALEEFAENNSTFNGLDVWMVGVLQALAKRLSRKNDQKSAENEMNKWDSEKVRQVIDRLLPMALQEHVSLSAAFNKVSSEVLK